MIPCTHGMPDPASCTECMFEGNIAPPPKREPEHATSRPFDAKYAGDCGICHLAILMGASVVYTNRDRVVHAGCPS